MQLCAARWACPLAGGRGRRFRWWASARIERCRATIDLDHEVASLLEVCAAEAHVSRAAVAERRVAGARSACAGCADRPRRDAAMLPCPRATAERSASSRPPTSSSPRSWRDRPRLHRRLSPTREWARRCAGADVELRLVISQARCSWTVRESKGAPSMSVTTGPWRGDLTGVSGS